MFRLDTLPGVAELLASPETQRLRELQAAAQDELRAAHRAEMQRIERVLMTIRDRRIRQLSWRGRALHLIRGDAWLLGDLTLVQLQAPVTVNGARYVLPRLRVAICHRSDFAG